VGRRRQCEADRQVRFLREARAFGVLRCAPTSAGDANYLDLPSGLGRDEYATPISEHE